MYGFIEKVNYKSQMFGHKITVEFTLLGFEKYRQEDALQRRNVPGMQITSLIC